MLFFPLAPTRLKITQLYSFFFFKGFSLNGSTWYIFVAYSVRVPRELSQAENVKSKDCIPLIWPGTDLIGWVMGATSLQESNPPHLKLGINNYLFLFSVSTIKVSTEQLSRPWANYCNFSHLSCGKNLHIVETQFLFLIVRFVRD